MPCDKCGNASDTFEAAAEGSPMCNGKCDAVVSTTDLAYIEEAGGLLRYYETQEERDADTWPDPVATRDAVAARLAELYAEIARLRERCAALEKEVASLKEKNMNLRDEIVW